MKEAGTDSAAEGLRKEGLPDPWQLVERCPALIAVADLDGRFKHVNPAWSRVLGHSPEALLGQPLSGLIHPADTDAAGPLAAPPAPPDGAGLPREGAFECRCLDAGGGHRWLAWTWTADPEAGLVHIVARDVTGERARQAELERALRQLRDSNAQLESFASVASHDMREPLRMITNYLKLFRERYSGLFDEKAVGYFEYALEGAERLRRLIEDLLHYAAIGAGEVRFETVDLEEVARGAVAQFEVAIRECGADVALEGAWPQVRGDALRLSRLLQNLVGNALKFSHPERPPVVRLGVCGGGGADEGRMWWLSVRDNGIGIAPEYEPYLFTLFHRLHTADEYDGSGIGLAVCKKIAEQHGGRIWYESETGRGSTFFVALPCG